METQEMITTAASAGVDDGHKLTETIKSAVGMGDIASAPILAGFCHGAILGHIPALDAKSITAAVAYTTQAVHTFLADAAIKHLTGLVDRVEKLTDSLSNGTRGEMPSDLELEEIRQIQKCQQEIRGALALLETFGLADYVRQWTTERAA